MLRCQLNCLTEKQVMSHEPGTEKSSHDLAGQWRELNQFPKL